MKARAQGRRLAALLGVALVAGAALAASRPSQDAPASRPETVMLVYQAKGGQEDALAAVIAKHWDTARKLDLVQPEPHLTLRTAGEGKTSFVDVFTWRDINTPDDPPAEIRAIWKELNAVVEARDGKPGLEITEMKIVAPAAAAPKEPPGR